MPTKSAAPLSFGKKTKRRAGLCAAGAVLLLFYFLPPAGSLSHAGLATVGMQLSFLLLLLFEALPTSLTCLIFLALMPLLRVTGSFGAALSGFSNPVVFYILASFGIAAAFSAVPLSRRVLLALLRAFGRDFRSILLAMMVCTALLSSIVSNVPTCAIFMSIALRSLTLFRDPEQKRRVGRIFMIAIPVASMIGGMATPAGSSINLLTIALLERYAGVTITFVQWMCAGVPLVVVFILLAWLLICRVYPLPALEQQTLGGLDTSLLEVPEKLEKNEYWVLAVTAVMLVLWVLSSWVSAVNVMVVALLGCCVFMLPGVGILDPAEFLRDNSWSSFLLVGTVISLGDAMVQNGVSDWLTTLLPAVPMPAPVLLGFVALVMFALLVIIPVAPSLVTVVAAPLIALATRFGVSPALVMLAAGLCACNCYLLPLDTVTQLTYGTGYYTMGEMAKSTLPLQLLFVVFTALWLPVVGWIFGML